LDRLYEYYGRPEYDGPDDLLAVLIRTILSQNTTRINTDRAFGRLVDRFHGDWKRIEKAPVDDVVDAIEIGGLARQKAPRIQRILAQIRDERGEYTLAFLRDKDAEKARDYLLDFKGVGPKTAAFTLMDAADFEVFPMDTHILRICKRLGWIDESTTSKFAHQLMEPEIPDGEHYSAHIVMVKHGREICHARNPECAECPLVSCCPTGQQRVE
jgi:endonuclease-3